MPITDVTAKLNLTSTVSTLTGSLSALTSPGGALHDVQIPASDDDLDQATQGASQVDTSGISATVEQLAQQILPLVAQIPGAGDLIRPIESALEVVEQVAGGELFQQLQDLAGRFQNELTGTREGGFLGTLERLLELVQGAEEIRSLLGLIRTLTGASGLNLGAAGKVMSALPAALGTARALAALMALESSLSEAERLTKVMQDQLSPESVNQVVGALEGAFGTGGASLAQFVSSIDVTKPAEVSAARNAIKATAARLTDLDALLSRSLGFGEATLVHLDPAAIRAEVTQATGVLSSVDTGPIRAAVQGLVDAMDPVLSITPPAGPATQLDTLLDFLHEKAEDIADAITGVDITPVTGKITEGLGAVTGALDQVVAVMTSVVNTIRSALESVRQAVEALPFDQITSTVQAVLAPVNAVMDFIADLVDGITIALNSVIPPVRTGLLNAETAINAFKKAALDLLEDAADFIESLHLDQVIGTVADNIRGLANTLAQAQMTPYFDTAVDVIGTTADVFEALPLDLLPDNIKQEVDAAAAPIRAIDVEAVKTTVEGWFQIDPDTGEFLLRAPLEEALEELQTKYDTLISQVRGFNPRNAIPVIDAELVKINTAIDDLVPRLSLQPVQDAIDQVKGVLNDFDLHQLLQPVDDAFNQVLETVDQYSPAALIAPLEERVTQARQKVVDTIKLDQWGPTLQGLVDQVKGLMARLDVNILEAVTAALVEANALFDKTPDFRLGSAFGSLLSSMLAGTGLRIHPWTFDVVLGWLSGDSGSSALTGRAQRTAAQVEATLASVQALDLSGIASRLGPRVEELRAAVNGLPAGAARTQLLEEVGALDVDRKLGALTANRTRYLGLLQEAAADCGALRSVGLSQVDVAMDGLGSAFEPLGRVRDFLRSLLRALGIPSLDASLKEIVKGILAVVTPEKVAGIFTPILGAVRGRVAAVLDELTAPLQAAIDDLEEIVATFDLKPLKDGLQAVYDELRAGIASLSPSQVLAPTLDSFDDLKATLLAFNPLQALEDLIEQLVEVAHRLLTSLSGEVLLESPIRIYDEVMKALEALNLQSLLEPVLDALDSIGEQVDTGLDRTAEALVRLQDALPSPSGGGSSGSGSVSVG